MCGIVGYIGGQNATPILLDGLSKLEYRGYDSAGITILNHALAMETRKCKGRLASLIEKTQEEPIAGEVGIGHTRWATHGEPSDKNSHPQTSGMGTVSVVHNGIIENYLYLKNYLQKKGIEFYSDTDSEVIPNLIDYYYKGDLLEAVIKAASKMEGSYAIGVISEKEPDKIICVRKDSPLIVGAGNGENYIASDVPAILKYTRQIYYLKDNEFALLTKDGVTFFNNEKEKIEKQQHTVTWNADAAEKGGFEHFMLKEIHEQPKVIKDTMASRIELGKKMALDDLKLSKEEIEKIEKMYIVACGTAYHAGMIGKFVIETLAKIPVETDIASEFRYRNPIIDDKMLLIVISQSGETADTLAAMREGKKKGAKVLAVTNVVGSSIAREADYCFYTWAGLEIAVASTKAYVTQLIGMYILGLYFAQEKNTLSSDEIEKLKEEMLTLPEKANQMLGFKETLQKFASQHFMRRDMFYIGRGLDYALSMEGALKLKEISYIHTESYAGGELKHGTIALMEEGTVVIALVTQKNLIEKMISNIKEVTTRGATVFAFAQEGMDSIEEAASSCLYIPLIHDMFAPVCAVIPLQLFAYYVAVMRGCDVDKPRNLAKSVTVE